MPAWTEVNLGRHAYPRWDLDASQEIPPTLRPGRLGRHRPRLSAGKHGDEDMAPLWDALRGHAVLVVNGHDHNVQRFAPTNGITQIIAGAGGANHYALRRGAPGLEMANDSEVAGLRLKLRSGRADYAVVTSEGRTLDMGRIACHPLAPAP